MTLSTTGHIRGVPVAPGWLPLLGHGLRLWRRPLEFLTSLPALGDLVEIRLGPRPAYVVCQPELAHSMLLDARTFDKGGPFYQKVRRLAGDGVATAPYEPHRRQRRLCQPAFQHDRLIGYTRVMRQETAAMLSGWQDDTVIDAAEALSQLTARVTVRTMFTADTAGPAVAEMCHSSPIVFDGIYRRMIAPVGLTHRLPTPANRRDERALRRLHAVVDDLIAAYRAAGVDHGDVLSMLLAARDDGPALSDAEIHDQVITLFVAGAETTAATLAWVLYLLGSHPGITERLRAEVDTTLAGRSVGFEDLAQLDLTGRVITEALRLYPPGWLLTRTVTRDTTLGAFPIPAGSTMVYSPYLLHRHPGVWQHPDRFDPDRWLPDQAATVPKGAYVPFAAGARQCIGDQFGSIEAAITLAAIIADWSLDPVPGMVVTPLTRISLRPDRLPMRLRRRQVPAAS